jgi:hypothetical protein
MIFRRFVWDHTEIGNHATDFLTRHAIVQVITNANDVLEIFTKL